MNKIRELRRALGMVQKELAEIMSVSQVAVARWEIGETMPRADKLPRLAEALKCEISDLFT